MFSSHLLVLFDVDVPYHIRLVGPNPSEGRVEVSTDGTGFGTVCSNGWDNKVFSTHEVCKSCFVRSITLLCSKV